MAYLNELPGFRLTSPETLGASTKGIESLSYHKQFLAHDWARVDRQLGPRVPEQITVPRQDASFVIQGSGYRDQLRSGPSYFGKGTTAAGVLDQLFPSTAPAPEQPPAGEWTAEWVAAWEAAQGAEGATPSSDVPSAAGAAPDWHSSAAPEAAPAQEEAPAEEEAPPPVDLSLSGEAGGLSFAGATEGYEADPTARACNLACAAAIREMQDARCGTKLSIFDIRTGADPSLFHVPI